MFSAISDFFDRLWKYLQEKLTALWIAIRKPLMIAVIIFVVLAGAGVLTAVLAGTFLGPLALAISASPFLALFATIAIFYLIDASQASELVEEVGEIAEDVTEEVVDVVEVIGEGTGKTVGAIISGLFSSLGPLVLPVAAAATAYVVLTRDSSTSGESDEFFGSDPYYDDSSSSELTWETDNEF